jgi:large subunit ribosomal protein L30
MIRIKWVRSGIGFTHHQKTIVRSLGLNKLNHTVLRPDSPQIRGIVASVPHLLEIVPEPVAPAWASIPEYTVHAAAPAASTVTETAQTGASEAQSADIVQDQSSSPEASATAEAGKE